MFLRTQERVREVPVLTREEPQVSYGNSKKKEILTSTKDEALFRCGISREIPPSLLSLDRFLDNLDATQEVPRHPRLHSRGTPRVPPQLKQSPIFASSSRAEGPFPCTLGKGIPAGSIIRSGDGLGDLFRQR